MIDTIIRYYQRRVDPVSGGVVIERLPSDTPSEACQIELTRTDRYTISTVFLGLDHSFAGWPNVNPDRVPVLWETLVFCNENEDLEIAGERYTSEADAIAGHHAAVQRWLAA